MKILPSKMRGGNQSINQSMIRERRRESKYTTTKMERRRGTQ
jgi:hypothetical protein